MANVRTLKTVFATIKVVLKPRCDVTQKKSLFRADTSLLTWTNANCNAEKREQQYLALRDLYM